MDDKSVWDKCSPPLIPRRTIDGKWTLGFGQCWRRKINGRWEYKQDEEDDDSWLSRQI